MLCMSKHHKLWGKSHYRYLCHYWGNKDFSLKLLWTELDVPGALPWNTRVMEDLCELVVEEWVDVQAHGSLTEDSTFLLSLLMPQHKPSTRCKPQPTFLIYLSRFLAISKQTISVTSFDGTPGSKFTLLNFHFALFKGPESCLSLVSLFLNTEDLRRNWGLEAGCHTFFSCQVHAFHWPVNSLLLKFRLEICHVPFAVISGTLFPF